MWVAYHEALETEVAVKFVHTEVAKKNPAAVKRFKREAGIAAKLKNPHGVHVYHHGLLEDDTPYIVMELLEGESLHRRLKREGVLGLHETALVVTQVAQVLGKAHKLGIVHRDVKPPNLFCVETGYELFIKLLDFGIAKQVANYQDMGLTSTDAMVGSPLYMSPEQFTSAKGVDWRGDLWSLAVVAYHCLTGLPPFTGETLGQVMMKVMTMDYPLATSIKTDLEPAVDAWFRTAFAENIEDRYQSAQELADAFVAATRGEVVPTSKPSRSVSITSLGPGRRSAPPTLSGPGPRRRAAASNAGNTTADAPVSARVSRPSNTPAAARTGDSNDTPADAPVDTTADDDLDLDNPPSVDPATVVDAASSATFAPTATLTPRTTADGEGRLPAKYAWRLAAAALALLLLVGTVAAITFSNGGTNSDTQQAAQTNHRDDGTLAPSPSSAANADDGRVGSQPGAAPSTSESATAASAQPSSSAKVDSPPHPPPPRNWKRPPAQPAPAPNKYGI